MRAPYVNEIAEVEVHPDGPQDVIVRMHAQRVGWVSCRISRRVANDLAEQLRMIEPNPSPGRQISQ